MDPISSTQSSDGSTTGAQAQAKAKDTQNQFLLLLVAQLKGQNPLDPIEGSEFVAQLAQFSSLEELTKIRTSMDEVQKVLSQSAAATGKATAEKQTPAPETTATETQTTEEQN